MEKVRIKLIKNEDSINVISTEESYYAKGVNGRKLEGDKFEYAYLDTTDIRKLSKIVAKELRNSKTKKKVKYEEVN